MKRWKQKIKYALGTAAGTAAFFMGTIPAAAATHTPVMLVGALKPTNLVIPGIAVVISIFLILFKMFHKRNDD